MKGFGWVVLMRIALNHALSSLGTKAERVRHSLNTHSTKTGARVGSMFKKSREWIARSVKPQFGKVQKRFAALPKAHVFGLVTTACLVIAVAVVPAMVIRREITTVSSSSFHLAQLQPWAGRVGITLVTILALYFLFRLLHNSEKFRDFRARCETRLWDNLNMILFGTVAIIALVWLAYTKWPARFLYLKPENDWWGWLLLLACLALWPIDPKVFFRALLVVYFVLLGFNIFDKSESHFDSLRPVIHVEKFVVKIDKDWRNQWIKPSNRGKQDCNTDGKVDYQMMGPQGQVVTALAVPSSRPDTVFIHGSLDSTQFRLIDKHVNTAVVTCYVSPSNPS